MRYSVLNRNLGVGGLMMSLALAQLATAARSVATMPPALRDLQPRLAAIIKRSQPSATLKWDAEQQELIGQYQTQPFQVHGTDKTGHLSPRAYTVWGPNYQGFLMRLRVDKTPYAGQSADPFRVWHRTYWDEYINEYPLPNKSGYLRLELAYGSRVDSKFVQQIKDTLASYAMGGVKPPTAATITRLETVAKVAAIEHTVEIRYSTEAYHTVKIGEAVEVGELVRTGRRSKADIKFKDGSLLRMGQNTEAKISAPDKVQILSGQAMLANMHEGGVEIVTKDGATIGSVKGFMPSTH